MIEKIRKIVEGACRKPTNDWGYGAWTHHILPSAKYAKLMARELGANKEIAEIAALLHDYASVKDKKLCGDHHLHGARLAEEILKKYNYPKGKIEKVKQCILSHRGSKPRKKLTKEAVCVADADAMTHFDSVAPLFQLAFIVHKKGIDEANGWLMQKLERDWKKLSPEGKRIVRDKYEAARILLGSKK